MCSSPRFPDCQSCAFYQVEEAICDTCEEADQWEPADPQELFNLIERDNPTFIPIARSCYRAAKRTKIKEAA